MLPNFQNVTSNMFHIDQNLKGLPILSIQWMPASKGRPQWTLHMLPEDFSKHFDLYTENVKVVESDSNDFYSYELRYDYGNVRVFAIFNTKAEIQNEFPAWDGEIDLFE